MNTVNMSNKERKLSNDIKETIVMLNSGVGGCLVKTRFFGDTSKNNWACFEKKVMRKDV